MAKVKYQVFISSTYEDLKEERKAVMNKLMQTNCIPVGMEDFYAKDEEQFNSIKSIIDDCDYYVVIIGNQYGSVHPQTGISYTEMEYDYAIKKEIPVLAFIRKIDEDTKLDIDIRKKLEDFKKKVRKNRMCRYWDDISNLTTDVTIAVLQATNENPRPGWIRNPQVNNEDLLQQIVNLQNENKKLLEKYETLKEKMVMADKLQTENLAFENTEFTLHFDYYCDGPYCSYPEGSSSIVITLDDLFKKISLFINVAISEQDFKNMIINSYSFGESVDQYVVLTENEVLRIKRQFILLGLFEEYDNGEWIGLSEKGKIYRDKMNAIYKDER